MCTHIGESAACVGFQANGCLCKRSGKYLNSIRSTRSTNHLGPLTNSTQPTRLTVKTNPAKKQVNSAHKTDVNRRVYQEHERQNETSNVTWHEIIPIPVITLYTDDSIFMGDTFKECYSYV